MNTKFDRPVVWASVLCALALAGCDAVKDVRSEPATELPKEKVVLKGVLNGLGGGRAITMRYNSSAEATSFIGADPSQPTEEPEPVPFTFGSLDEGTAYNIEIIGQPFGKQCAMVSGASGTLTKGQETNIVIDCVPNIPRYDLTVSIPPTPEVFSGLPGAKVVLYTGEQMHAQTVTSGQTQVVFPGALFSAAGQPAALTYTVSASVIDGAGKESRCRVTNPSGSNPSGHVTNVIVGASANTTELACQFTMSGSVAYSAPPGGGTETGAIPGGLLLEVRDVQGNVKATHEVTDYGNFTVGGATPTLFSSNVDAIYDVVVARQPVGRSCVVGDGGAVSFYRTGSNNPVNVTATAAPGAATNTRAWGSRLNVFCRALPAAGQELNGTFRLTRTTWTPAPTTNNPNPSPVTVRYDNYDWTVQNLGSSDMMTFFPDGTFLFGTHGYNSGLLPDFSNAAPYWVQVEHGFYDFDPVAGTLRFTLITDTNPTAVFPSTFGPISNLVWNASRAGTPGLSAAPNPVVSGTPTAGAGIGIWTAVMNDVQRSAITFDRGRNPSQSLARITGSFGGAAPRLEWELTEPQSITGEMTGTWISRDHRRFWVWDYLTYYGTHVGVAGGAPSMNDACFTVSKVEASHGVYTRRGTSTGCYPYNRPSRGTGYLFGFTEAVDFHLTDTTVSTNTFMGVPALATAARASVTGSRLAPQFGTTALAVLPGFVGRIPGGQSAADGRSPSPVVYLIAPAASFATAVGSTTFEEIGEPAARYFDNLDDVGAFTDWCQSDVLAIRATLHAEPIDYPVYFCRTRAN